MASGSVFPILLLIAVAFLVAAGMIATSALIGPRRQTPVKQMPYESGMDPVGDARGRFDVRFHLMAILFLIFDVELLFLYPWAVSAWDEQAGLPTAAAASGTSLTGIFIEVLVFMLSLVLAYVYAWRRGVFRWRG
jgi:NADH-quinone oxidoreductase subunit A